MSVLIFDFDGTIADSMELAIEIFYEVSGRPRVTDPARIEYLRTLPLLKVAKEAKVAPHQIPRLLFKGRALMHKRIDEVKTFPHLHDVLGELHNRGFQLFVMSSNTKQNVEHFLEKHNLADYFDGVYGGVGLFSKTGALRKIMRRNKLAASDCYYIGDEVRDMNAAHKAGVRAVAVAWGYNNLTGLQKAKPFEVAETPTDLVRIFKRTI